MAGGRGVGVRGFGGSRWLHQRASSRASALSPFSSRAPIRKELRSSSGVVVSCGQRAGQACVSSTQRGCPLRLWARAAAVLVTSRSMQGQVPILQPFRDGPCLQAVRNEKALVLGRRFAVPRAILRDGHRASGPAACFPSFSAPSFRCGRLGAGGRRLHAPTVGTERRNK